MNRILLDQAQRVLAPVGLVKQGAAGKATFIPHVPSDTGAAKYVLDGGLFDVKPAARPAARSRNGDHDANVGDFLSRLAGVHAVDPGDASFQVIPTSIHSYEPLRYILRGGSGPGRAGRTLEQPLQGVSTIEIGRPFSGLGSVGSGVSLRAAL